MKLYVTRHGETLWNAENKVCGQTESPLTEKGRQQAVEGAKALLNLPIDLVLCSPMERARETARLLLGELGERDIPVLTEPKLTEQDYGVYEGADRGDPGFLKNKQQFAVRYPGGESQMDTAARIYPFLDTLPAKYPGKNILLVCHGGVSRIIESYFHDMDNDTFFRFSMGNCELRQYDIPEGKAPERVKVTMYGAQICSGCREALALFQQKGFRDFRFVEITGNVPNLREFLKLRDTLPQLQGPREEGRIGIPLFILEDGSVETEAEDLLRRLGV